VNQNASCGRGARLATVITASEQVIVVPDRSEHPKRPTNYNYGTLFTPSHALLTVDEDRALSGPQNRPHHRTDRRHHRRQNSTARPPARPPALATGDESKTSVLRSPNSSPRPYPPNGALTCSNTVAAPTPRETRAKARLVPMPRPQSIAHGKG